MKLPKTRGKPGQAFDANSPPSAQYHVRAEVHPFTAHQKSIALSVMTHGEEALDYCSFGASGTRSYRLQTASTPPATVLWPSAQALTAAHALQQAGNVSPRQLLIWQLTLRCLNLFVIS